MTTSPPPPAAPHHPEFGDQPQFDREIRRLTSCHSGHYFTNTAPPTQKPIWQCGRCPEKRIMATGRELVGARKGGAA
jgi:hypothetical protein